MFFQIFLFEIKYRLRRPAFYVYFSIMLLFTAFGFAMGDLPVIEKEFVNAPGVLAMFSCMSGIFMMLVSSSIMGVPLYRDIEHNTKEYYLSYPITKAGYFWARFLGSFFFVVLIGIGIYLGAWLGSRLGPVLGWTGSNRYGPDHFRNYAYPFLTIMIPNLFFTSSIFFGLVAIFKNVKVIYSSGLFLFLGYIIGNFFLHNMHDPKVIYLTDPFLVNGMRYEIGPYSPDRLNSSVVAMQGLLLTNRIIWLSAGALILLLTYWRFSFEKFFGSAKEKVTAQNVTAQADDAVTAPGLTQVDFKGGYYRKNLYSLSRIELLNIIRDNYFWIILSGGIIFLGFVFWLGPGHYEVRDLPRSVYFMDFFNNEFNFFIFLILIFYTGETVHRERLTRYAFINDALPPPTWLLNCAKLISLCCLAIFLALVPILLGLTVQLIKGFHDFNFPIYLSTLFATTLPRLIAMVLFTYTIHIVVNHKFAGMGIGVTIWTLLYISVGSGAYNYHLLLYSYGPDYTLSDMDGIGHMLRPILWFNSYWLLAGALMVVAGSLLYARGTDSTAAERGKLARERWQGVTRIGIWILLIAFLATGGFIYYNVSYLNNYLTKKEVEQRAATTEKQLKARYGELPLPKITRAVLYVDLYPGEQRAQTKAFLTVINRGNLPIDSLLLDGDNLAEYTLDYNGARLGYTCPLYFHQGKFNVFHASQQASDYRVYRLPSPLAPGDSALLEFNGQVASKGFQNDAYATDLLDNGIYFSGGVPGFGYDADEEISSRDRRKEYGLPLRQEKEILQDDSVGQRTLRGDNMADLLQLNITVSTSPDQTAIAPGALQKEWTANGRHYFHYVQDQPGIYLPVSIVSAHYQVFRDTVPMRQGPPVVAEIYYHPAHGANLSRIAAACREGLLQYSSDFGPYPFQQMRIIETTPYGPWIRSIANTTYYGERSGWNADLREEGKYDYIYLDLAEQLAHQWWGVQQVAINSTIGSQVVRDAVSKYASLLLMQHKYGEAVGLRSREDSRREYFGNRHRNFGRENDMLHANKWYEVGPKGEVVLYGLRDLMGEDSLNAALQEFGRRFRFRDGGPYAGSRDLYSALRSHLPDSLRYYLEDTWEKVSFYDNKVVTASAIPLGKSGKYKVSVTVDVKKLYCDSAGNESSAREMNDYIDIAVFAQDSRKNDGTTQFHPLYSKRHRFTAGEHRIDIIVDGKPERAGIDPWLKLLDRQREDNYQVVTIK